MINDYKEARDEQAENVKSSPAVECGYEQKESPYAGCVDCYEVVERLLWKEGITVTLYKMTEAAKQLYERCSAGDIPEEAVKDTLEGIGVEGKIEDYCLVIAELTGDVLKAKNERAHRNRQTKYHLYSV